MYCVYVYMWHSYIWYKNTRIKNSLTDARPLQILFFFFTILDQPDMEFQYKKRKLIQYTKHTTMLLTWYHCVWWILNCTMHICHSFMYIYSQVCIYAYGRIYASINFLLELHYYMFGLPWTRKCSFLCILEAWLNFRFD